jgi:hypothetical protein
MSMLASRFMVEAQGVSRPDWIRFSQNGEKRVYQSRRENVDADYDDMPRFHPPALPGRRLPYLPSCSYPSRKPMSRNSNWAAGCYIKIMGPEQS